MKLRLFCDAFCSRCRSSRLKIVSNLKNHALPHVNIPDWCTAERVGVLRAWSHVLFTFHPQNGLYRVSLEDQISSLSQKWGCGQKFYLLIFFKNPVPGVPCLSLAEATPLATVAIVLPLPSTRCRGLEAGGPAAPWQPASGSGCEAGSSWASDRSEPRDGSPGLPYLPPAELPRRQQWVLMPFTCRGDFSI